MLLESIKKQIKTTNELFNEYTYMTKNLPQLENIRNNILSLIKDLEQYQDKIVNSWNITDLDYDLIKINLLDCLYKINVRINILRKKPIKYSDKQKTENYKIIKYYIITNNFQKLEKFLNENIIDLNYVPNDKNNINLLLLALDHHNFEIAKYLLQCGINPNVCDNQNKSALLKSIGNINFFKDLITIYGADINLAISCGTILHYACKFLDKKIIIFLLDQGADIKALNDEDDSVLHTLINERKIIDINENLEIIDILIENDIDIDWQNSDGWTPLHCATEIENINYVSILLDNGADALIKNSDGEMPKDIALKYGELEIFSLLKENTDVCQEKYKRYDDFEDDSDDDSDDDF